MKMSAISERIATENKLQNLVELHGGETGAELYYCEDSSGDKKVLKIGISSVSIAEVNDNIYGYAGITKAGATKLVPENITSGQIDSNPYLIMPNLGKNFTDKSCSGALNLNSILLDCITEIAEETTVTSSNEQLLGLNEFGGQLSRWYGTLRSIGKLTVNESLLAKQIDYGSLSSDKANIMLLDFTPDNVFIEKNSIKFIDPWHQSTYRGSVIPSLSQFQTLSEIYGLPETEATALDFQSAMDYIGSILNLSKEQIHKQILLGKILQYTLSGYVRVYSDPEKAQVYIRKSTSMLKRLI